MYSFFLIQSGVLKNKKVIFLNSINLRPSKNIIRSLVFSLIGININKIYMLDLFSGTGIISFEFFSRNAKKIIMLENNLNFFSCISRNIKSFNISLNNIYLNFMDSFEWLKKNNFLNISFVFFDPPYLFKNSKNYFDLLNNIYFLRKCVLFIIESGNSDILNFFPYNWFLIKKEHIGKTYIYLLKKI